MTSTTIIPDIPQLNERLAALGASLPGRLGVQIRYLESGLEAGYHADDLFPTASVIKVPIMVEVFRQAKASFLRLDDPLPLREAEMSAGSGLLQFLHPGLNLTVRDNLELMIALSDNTATNLLLALVGVETVNRSLSEMGLTCTRCSGPIGRPDAPTELPFISRTTPRELTWLLGELALGRLVSSEADAEMRTILGRQVYDGMLPRYLPLQEDPTVIERPRLAVQHKTGELDGVRNDAGIIRVECGGEVHTIAIGAFTADLDDHNLWTSENVGARAVAEVGRLAYEALLPSTACT